MKSITKQLLVLILLFSVGSRAFADRVFGKKTNNKITLNLNISSNLRNAVGFNLKTGLVYKGSLLSYPANSGNAIINNSISTYQKGNTIYIVPYKNKLTVTESKPGYTGIKIIIRK
jgi:hypothetical protein